MKKIAIITRHAVPNYGSLYQAYALQEAIKKITVPTEKLSLLGVFL